MQKLHQIYEKEVEIYSAAHPTSKTLYERACRVMPGGDTRSITWFHPYPSYITHGKGSRMWDADGNELIDFQCNYTSMIHGHAFPPIVAAVSEQIAKGSVFSTPLELQVRLAEILCGRVSSLERVRFCNSGTEATMHAVRAARAFTGRSKVLKLEGGYHGTSDIFETSVDPDLSKAGSIENPIAVAEGRGVTKESLSQVLIAPFNHKEITGQIIEAHKDEIAAFIVEPIQGSAGQITPQDGYLDFIREKTRQHGIMLIFDEVVSFRIAEGGAQQHYGITPDLSTFGKIIGGGLPIGAFGGRADIMDIYDPKKKIMSHSGTFNGNAISMAAGVAAMEHYGSEAVSRINDLGQMLRDKLAEAASGAGLDIRINGIGSLANIIFSNNEILEYRGLVGSKEIFNDLLSLSLINKGIFIAPRGMLCISTATTEADIEDCASKVQDCLSEMLPAIDEEAPELCC